MENVKEKKSKFNLKLWLPIFIGVFSIGMAFVVFITIYNSAPNLVLMKHDYNVLKNPDNKKLTAEDVYYSPLIEEDENIFDIGKDYIVVDLDKLRSDNPSYVFDEYRFEIAFEMVRHNESEFGYEFSINYSIDGSTPQAIGRNCYKNQTTEIEMISFYKSNSYAKFSFTNVNFISGKSRERFKTFDLALYGVKK